MAIETNTGILKGIRVLDFTIALAGPFVSWNLADMGAEVWKIEKHGEGDQTRYWLPVLNEMSTLYATYNKDKQSVEVNLGKQEGKEIIYEMVKHVDVVVENFKSGSIDRLGLGYEKLREINPKIVFASLSGFGGTGPLKKLPAYDAIAEARGGFASSSGEPDGDPMKVGSSIGDIVTGINTTNAILMALIEARRSGEGCHIDIGMTDVALNAIEETLMDYGKDGETQNRFGDHDRHVAPYGMFEARDGYACIIADSETRWASFCEAMGLTALKEDARFATNALRAKNRQELVPLIETVTRGLKRQEIEDCLLPVDVPASAVLSPIENYTSDHANEVGLSQFVHQDKIGMMRFYRHPLRYNDRLEDIEKGAPLLGAHTDEVLKQIGYSEEELAALHESGVIGKTMI